MQKEQKHDHLFDKETVVRFAKNQHRTAPIIDLKDVPPGFIQIADVLPDGDPRKKHWQRVLSDAHAEGRIRAVKLFRSAKDAKTGPVFVNREESLEYIRDYERRMAHHDVAETISAAPPPHPDHRAVHERRIAELLADNNGLLAAILDILREQARRSDSPQWHPAEDEVGA